MLTPNVEQIKSLNQNKAATAIVQDKLSIS